MDRDPSQQRTGDRSAGRLWDSYLDTDTFLADPGRLMDRLTSSILNLLVDVQAAVVAEHQDLTETPTPRRDSLLNAEAEARSHLALLELRDHSAESCHTTGRRHFTDLHEHGHDS